MHGENPKSICLVLPNRQKKALTFCNSATPKERSATRKPTYQNSFRKSLGLKGIKRRSIGVDIIKQISNQGIAWNKKLNFFLKHFLLLNFVAFFFTLLIKYIEDFHPNQCLYTPICIGKSVLERILISISDFFGYWMIWILLILFEVYQKLFRTIIFILSFVFIFFFYLLSEEEDFKWFPIYVFLFLLRLFRYLFLLKNLPMSGMFWLFYRSQSPAILLVINYSIFLYLADNIKNSIDKPWIDIFYSFYFLIFFIIFKHSLIKYGLYAYDHNFENQQQNFLIILGARIAICYFISFMSTPFLQFKLNEPTQYLVIFSYINNLITLYTRFNLFEYGTTKIYRTLFIKRQNDDAVAQMINSPEKEQIKNIDKIISGCTLDITFISSIKLIVYHLWPGNVIYSNCAYATTELGGIIIFVSVNILLTFSILMFMAKKREALFTYRGELNIIMNVYLLFLTNILFEITLSFFIGKL